MSAEAAGHTNQKDLRSPIWPYALGIAAAASWLQIAECDAYSV